MPNIYDLTGEFQMFSDIAEQGELTEEQAKMLDEALANLKEDIEYKPAPLPRNQYLLPQYL